MNQPLSSRAPGCRVASELSQRVMRRLRTCKDCTGAYRYSTTHTHSRYCPTCLPKHPRLCASCKTPFHPITDTDRLCPLHLVHEPLF